MNKEGAEKMIDFHSHILPNIDDGSRSIEETFNLIKEAESVGFEAIISTSHYIEGYYETNTPEREVWINAIYENLKISILSKYVWIEIFNYIKCNILLSTLLGINSLCEYIELKSA